MIGAHRIIMAIDLQASKHFSSGVNSAGDARGIGGSFRHFGITANEVRDGLLECIAVYAVTLQRLFVDSGAFGEVAFGPEGPRVVRPITEAQWDQIFRLFLWAAMTFGKNAYLVAPDRVGCQETTLERQTKYAERVRLLAALGAQVIVPVQKGALPMSQMFRRSCEILGIDDPIAGVPMKKDATSIDDLRELVASLPRLCRIHLLGIGPESPKFAAVISAILAIRPEADVTSDSVTIRRLVGRTNGRGGGPRALTRLQDQARGECGTPIGWKADALCWQAAEELGYDRHSESRSIMDRNEARVEVARLATERRAELALEKARIAAARPAQLQLALWQAPVPSDLGDQLYS